MSKAIDLNNLLDVQEVHDLRDVRGIARRAIGGLQVLRERSELVLHSVEREKKIYSSSPGCFYEHGNSLSIKGETGPGLSKRQVHFVGTLPVYRTTGGRPSFRRYDGGNVPFDLTFTVKSASSDEESTFHVRHGNGPWEGHYDYDHRRSDSYIVIDDEGARYELPYPVSELVRDVVQRLCEQVLLAALDDPPAVEYSTTSHNYDDDRMRQSLALFGLMPS